MRSMAGASRYGGAAHPVAPRRSAIEAQAVRVEANVPKDNLVANALKAMPGGGILRITAAGRSGHALLEPADSGPGVPAESPCACSIRSSPPGKPETRDYRSGNS